MALSLSIYERRREMGLGALRDVSLKQACKYITGRRSVLHEEPPSMKECEKQKP
nr:MULTISPECIES: hypothetical protein [Bartonella]